MKDSVLVSFEPDGSLGRWLADDRTMTTLAELVAIVVGAGGVRINFTVPGDAVAIG